MVFFDIQAVCKSIANFIHVLYIQHAIFLSQFHIVFNIQFLLIIVPNNLYSVLVFNNFNSDMSSHQDSDKLYINSASSKADRLKEIDALYRSQIKLIYNQSKQVVKQREKEAEIKREKSPTVLYTSAIKKVGSNRDLKDQPLRDYKDEQRNQKLYRSPQADSRMGKQPSSTNLGIEKKLEQDKVRASVYLQGESTRTIQVLRKQNQMKQLKIRELTNKCENLIERLKNNLSEAQFNKELESLKQFSDTKMERLENLFKIKNQEIFFKMKLQIIGLLQQFQVSKEEINGINQVNNQSALYSFMVRKLKLKLKDFRSKEQESNFQIQKDKILNQKYQERIHYLLETNQLLKLSQSKLKSKIQELRAQMNQFLDKLKSKQKQIEQKESEIFRLKKQNQQLHSTNQKLSHSQRNISSERSDEKKIFEAKEKQMKGLLSSYFLERKKLESSLQEKQGELEQVLIRQKFLQQENERINREYVRWKERYQWLQKEKENRQRQYEQEKAQLLADFMEYKNENNQSVYMNCKAETDDAIRKVQEYQIAYQKIITELEEERKARMLKQQQSQAIYQESERQWLDKIKRIQKMKEEEMFELAADHENRQKQIREEYEKRQQLISEQLQARMKALLAQNDKKSTERLIELENEKDQLRRQIQDLTRVIEVKESLIHVMNTNNTQGPGQRQAK